MSEVKYTQMVGRATQLHPYQSQALEELSKMPKRMSDTLPMGVGKSGYTGRHRAIPHLDEPQQEFSINVTIIRRDAKSTRTTVAKNLTFEGALAAIRFHATQGNMAEIVPMR